jgi:uncharacterized protein
MEDQHLNQLLKHRVHLLPHNRPVKGLLHRMEQMGTTEVVVVSQIVALVMVNREDSSQIKETFQRREVVHHQETMQVRVLSEVLGTKTAALVVGNELYCCTRRLQGFVAISSWISDK